MNYYKQGDAANADKIKAAFEAKGYHVGPWDYGDELFFFFSINNGHIRAQRIPGGNKDYEACLIDIIKTHPDYQELELPVEPCFKVGDKIEATIYGIKRRVTIREVDKTNLCYFGTLEECIGFSEQDQWHLAPKPHYDIANFKPFDKVLVRDNDRGKWRPSIFSYHIKGRQTCYPFCCIGNSFSQCIPFEGNEHLLGTTDMPSEEYINW